MAEAVVHRLTVYPLAIRLRREVVTAVSRWRTTDPVVVAVELTNGRVGYGETVAAHHVTGETAGSVVDVVRDVFAPALVDFHPASFPEALERIEALPWRDAKQHLTPAVRACVELALLDAVMGTYQREVGDVVQWMGLPGFGAPGSLRHARFGGVLATDDARTTMRQLRSMYWGGIRSFKLKVGFGDDRGRLARVAGYLTRPVAAGRAMLRIDANGRWSKDEAIEWLGDAAHLRLAGVEQPLARGDEQNVSVLRDLFEIPIIFDESLLTIEDGRRLIDLGMADGFHIRIAKCGGLMPSLRLAALGRRAGVRIELGGVAGETSILSTAALRFLEVCPGPVAAEGCYGLRLLQEDIVKKSLCFGYGGRPPKLVGHGLNPGVDTERLDRLAEDRRVVINL